MTLLFLQKKVSSNSKLLVIGGGALQDSVGFLASIYHRGIPYILVPTTLLAQVDSCIGGKTSIDIDNNKNIIGTFYSPEQVIVYKQFVKTLTTTDFLSGVGEIYKFMVLQGRIKQFDIRTILREIQSSIQYKQNIIELDQFDTNQRKILNFGHTIGHALQSTSNYLVPHGIAVVVGIIVSGLIGQTYNYTNPDLTDIIDTGIEILLGSAVKFQKSWFNENQLINAVLNDKKNINNINMIVLDTIPKLVSVSKCDIKEGISTFCELMDIKE